MENGKPAARLGRKAQDLSTEYQDEIRAGSEKDSQDTLLRETSRIFTMKKLALAAALAAATSTASAATWELTELSAVTSNGTSAAVLGGDLGFEIGVGNSLVGDGEFTALFTTIGGGAGASLFTWEVDQLTLTAGGDASSVGFNCIEGIFGGFVGSHLCNNTGAGGAPIGPVQTIDQLDGMSPTGGDFTTIILLGNGPDLDYFTMTFTSAVPVPAAAWLFGSALVGLAGVGRKRKMA